jgi:ABC-type antimicrobial peptide transport system permease subunit
MVTKNLSLAFRHIMRYRAYSFLNIIGLAIGMASAMLIIIWANHELNTDKFHKNGKNIYLLHHQMKWSDGRNTVFISTGSPIGPAMVAEIPEVKACVRIPWRDRLLFRLGQKSFEEDGIFADSVFFQVFSYCLKSGDPKTVLNSLNSVVISEKLAKKYFGNENPIGKVFKIRVDLHEELYTVTGVCKNVSGFSSLKFEFVIPFGKLLNYRRGMDHWGNNWLMTYVLAQPGVNLNILNKKITDLLYKHAPFEKNTDSHVFAQPFEEAYLHSDYGESMSNPSGLILYVKIFLWVAVFILILAGMNYTNMATALAIKRAKEVGVKKTFGSGRIKLLSQFLLESYILSFAGFVLSIFIVNLCIPYFNLFVGKDISFDFTDFKMIALIISVPILTGFISGAFPAMYLSSFNTITALKKIKPPKKGQVQLRHILVVLQFVITITFIIATLVVVKQLRFMQNKDLGLDKENIIFFGQTTQIVHHRQSFKDELLRQEGVAGVTYTNMSPFGINNNTGDPTWRGKNLNDNFLIDNMNVDQDFIKFFSGEIIAGRDFSMAYPADTNCIIINERFAKTMGMENPVGEVVRYWGRTAPVIGVVKDFHTNNLHQPIRQMMLICRPSETWEVMVKLEKFKTKQALKNIENVFRQYDEAVPFEYEFIDKNFEKNFELEKYLGRLSNIFAVLAIIISCLGLFGLALFTAEQSTKEIGVRKSVGATTFQVMLRLALQFLKWIVISFVIASAIAWFVLDKWLQSYAYKTELSWWLFLLTGIIALGISLITVSWQAWRAASRNPVESLRYE